MNKYLKEFIKRGLMCCFGGPLILAIVWLCLYSGDVANSISLCDAGIAIISVTVLAFMVAGISMIYQIEKLPIVIAGLIQFSVIYFSYLVTYLINGWLESSIIWIFTIIFVGSFIVIWIVIYLLVNRNVKKINNKICQ